MSVLELVERRYSVRGYQDREIEKDKLLQILEAGRLAPSAVNFQPVHLYVLDKKEDQEKLYEVYRREWFMDSPVIIVICGDHTKSWKRKDGKDHCDIDAAIVVDHMTLAATELGLGTCWICAFDAQRSHELLALPENIEVITLLTIGYASVEPPTQKKRISMEEFVTFGLQ
ncbi:MAG: nfrA2 [Herbinix sp.]|jgi:nitroreductase|nr:nfrA2 [Herbinix sp.]